MVANKKAPFVTLMDRFEAYWSQLFANDSVCLQIAQVPNNDNNTADYLTPWAYARGNND